MTRHVRLAVAIAALTCAACSHYEEVRLQTFDDAMALATTTSPPAFFQAWQVPSDLPLATPFAQVVGDFPSDYSTENQGWRLNDESIERGFRPDFIVLQPRGLASEGDMMQVSPVFASGGIYGFSFASTPVLRTQSAAICYRLAPVALGVTLDANFMVTHVDEAARASGIMEGDSVQSIDGAAVRPRTMQDVAPWLCVALRHKPGDEAAIEWIRPGTGRMRGKLSLVAPVPMPPDAAPVPRPDVVDPY